MNIKALTITGLVCGGLLGGMIGSAWISGLEANHTLGQERRAEVLCQKQTDNTTPTYHQCVADQFEMNGDK